VTISPGSVKRQFVTTSTNDLVIPDTITIDAVGPMPILRPATAAEVGEIVRRCAAEGTAVYPVGGGTMLDYGLPPVRPGVAVELRALDKVIDFPASDMTITVEAGITIARLNQITRAEGLHLPIDVPDPERATLGGAIACNVSGPRRYGYGTFRDYILGITTINDRGEAVSAGGRVVKNVAGYDLMKLHTGALGTLGAITQVTLKLQPVPEAWALFYCAFRRECLANILDITHQSATRPAILGFRQLGHGSDSADQFWSLVAVFEGGEEAVAWQQTDVQKALSGQQFSILDGRRGKGSMDGPFTGTFADVIWRATLPQSGAASFAEGVADSEGSDLWAEGGGGIVRGAITFVNETNDLQARDLLRRALVSACGCGGNLIIERCPSEWKTTLSVWGRPPADLALQKSVKRALDPQNIFNPGRFVTDAF
jgi:glycolate oxidase FAD binding subunit